MTFKTLLLAALLCLSLPRLASAIDPGRVQGSLLVHGQPIALTQAYAHLHDNAERLLDRPRELRLLLVDREVPQEEALAGLSLLTLKQMAREGRLQGLLLQLDPSDHRRLDLTLLQPPPAPDQQLFTWTITLAANSSAPQVTLAPSGERAGVRGEKRNNVGQSITPPKPAFHLNIHPQRVNGNFTCPPAPETAGWPDLACDLRFSAPLFHELPVTAVLTGRAAVSWAKRLTVASPGALPPVPRRVVVRGHRATAVFPGGRWQTFARQGGEWKPTH